ncbi:MAG: hypothetical protein DRH50_11465 [Deltaproteobacteria bacterium]|nr:MAG: hypothetical protein DRH50_11465 [Deltaproteobacteria bacterium]
MSTISENRIKRDIFFYGIIALAVHIAILSAPIPDKSNRCIHRHRLISVSVIHPKKEIPAISTVATSRQESVRTQNPQKRVLSRKQAVALKKKVPRKKASRQTSPQDVKRLSSEQVRKKRGQTQEAGGKKVGTDLVASTARASSGVARKKGPETDREQAQANVTYAAPKYKENPLPHYPWVARRRGYEGRTLLRVEVLENGKVRRVEVEQSSGFEVLDRAALKSVKGWSFVPGTKNGKKIKQWVTVPVRFTLR